MQPRVTNALKILWFLACLAVLAWGIIGCDEKATSTLRGECALLAGYVLALLNLPLSIVWWLLLSAAGYAFYLAGIEITDSPAFGAVVWLGFVVVGYLQWFKLVPWLIAKWRSRHSARLQV